MPKTEFGIEPRAPTILSNSISQSFKSIDPAKLSSGELSCCVNTTIDTITPVSFLSIDSAAGMPPFEQVRSQLAKAIDSGILKPQDQLPTVRKLATDLGLAANTVARAYRELELIGVIETRGRNGTFVAGALSPRKAAGARLAATLAQRMRDLGMGEAEMLAIFRNEVEGRGGAGKSTLRTTS